MAPSSLNWTEATPTLSEAVAETVTVPETVEPEAGAVREMVGAWVSAVETNVAVTTTAPETVREQPADEVRAAMVQAETAVPPMVTVAAERALLAEGTALRASVVPDVTVAEAGQAVPLQVREPEPEIVEVKA